MRFFEKHSGGGEDADPSHPSLGGVLRMLRRRVEAARRFERLEVAVLCGLGGLLQ
jgi:hypothetical protein